MGFGFGSLRSVPYLRTYAEALGRYNQTKPIRGSNPPVRPLGKRKNKHLRIEQTEDGAIQCWLYQTPVITFYPDGRVVISPGLYTTFFTCAFIENILPRVSGRHRLGNMVLDIRGKEYVVEEYKTLTLRRDEGNQYWAVEQAEGAWVFGVNKAKANNVRARFKSFLKFFDGFVKLNTQDVEATQFDDPDEPFTAKRVVKVSTDMLREVLGTRQAMVRNFAGFNNSGPVYNEVQMTFIDTGKWGELLHNKPIWCNVSGYNAEEHNRKRVADWLEQRDALAKLMASTETADHFMATLMLFCMEARVSGSQGTYTKAPAVCITHSKAKTLASMALLKMYAEDMLEYKQLQVGRIPSVDYVNWLFTDKRKEMMGDLVCGPDQST